MVHAVDQHAPPGGRAKAMNSSDRVLAIVALFTRDKRVWTADEIASRFGVSVSQAYRYCKSLVAAGFLDPLPPAGFALGPAFVEYDRLAQVSDPLLLAASAVMKRLSAQAPDDATVLFSKLYRTRVMCVDQVVGSRAHLAISFERGKPMQLLWGATAKVILAQLGPRELARVYAREIADQPVGAPEPPALPALRKELAAIRSAGFCAVRGEVDPGHLGIAAPISTAASGIVGSLTTVLPNPAADDGLVGRLAGQVMDAAREIESQAAACGARAG